MVCSSEVDPSLVKILFCSECSTCVLCDEHQLLAIGTEEGRIECWDPRAHRRVGVLDIRRVGEG